MLELTHLRVAYDGALAVADVSLRVGRGEVVAVIGANGAGKTTTLRAISGLTRAAGGEITFENQRIDSLRPEKVFGMGIVQCPEGRRLFPAMSVRENLLMGAYLRNDASAINRDMDAVCQMFPILKERMKQAVGTLSGGQQQMVAIGRSVMAGPKLLMLDEPSLGLAPRVTQEVFDAVAGIARTGVSVILVEQNAAAALEIADRGYVLETGHVRLAGEAKELLDNDLVKTAYLGA